MCRITRYINKFKNNKYTIKNRNNKSLLEAWIQKNIYSRYAKFCFFRLSLKKYRVENLND